MTQLVDQISGALDVEMAGVHEQLDAELSSQAIALHYTATAVPGGGEPDHRTTGMKRYAVVLSRDRVDVKHVEDAVGRMFADSLDPTFLEWTGKFCAANSRISENDVAARLTEFSVFIALRSVTSTESEIDKLLDAEEAERVRHDEALARYRESVKHAKDKLKISQANYDTAGRLRVRASALTSEIDTLTLTVPDGFRKCVLDAQERHLRRLTHPTRQRKPKTDDATESGSVGAGVTEGEPQ